MGNSITYNGKVYKSKSALARAYGIKPTAFIKKYTRTKSIEMALGLEKCQKAERCGSLLINGEFFATASDAARHFGLSVGLVHDRLAVGWSPEQAVGLVQRNTGKKFIVNDMEFIGKKRLIEHFGTVTLSQFNCRVDRGWTVEEALGLVPYSKQKSYTVDGKTFNSLSDLASYYGLNFVTVFRRLKNGATAEQAVLPKKEYRKLDISDDKRCNKVTVHGKVFKSLNLCAEHYGVKPVTVRARQRAGASLEEAILPEKEYRQVSKKKKSSQTAKLSNAKTSPGMLV